MSEPQNTDYLIDEYRTLREELMLHMKQEWQVIGASATLAFVVVGVFAKIDDPVAYQLSGLALQMLLAPLSMIYTHESFAIAKIASFLQKNVERELTGLSWTTQHIVALSRFAEREKEHSWHERVSNVPIRLAVILYFSLLLVLSWALPFYLAEGILPLSIALAMCVPTVMVIFNLLKLKAYNEHRSEWDSIWEELSEDQSWKEPPRNPSQSEKS